MTTRLVLKKFKKIVLASLYVNGIKICGSVGNEIQKFPKGDGFVVDVKLFGVTYSTTQYVVDEVDADFKWYESQVGEVTYDYYYSDIEEE